MNILNITNGDSTVSIMQKADIPGIFLPWRDVLHVGPVPGKLSLDELSKVRSDFILAQGWGSDEKVRQAFKERDDLIKTYYEFEKVILWFEHDLYDQLQILQILDWFYQNRPIQAELTLICHDQYLGMLTPTAMKALTHKETPVNETMLSLAHQVWSAFCSETPALWQGVLKQEITILPFLKAAVLRMLEEFPHCQTGLSRTETIILQIIAQGKMPAEKVFAQYQKMEERKFMGDTVFWKILEKLLKGRDPLLKLPDNEKLSLPTTRSQVLTLTQMGKAVLSGEKNFLDISEIDYWIGGVHLQEGNLWCRDGNQIHFHP